MRAWQRIIRERAATSGGDLFGRWWDGIDNSLDGSSVREISSGEASEIILEYEWLGDMPQTVRRCFGLFHGKYLAGALVFAEKPGSNLLSDATSIVPKDAHYLARGACVHWAHPHAASWFITRVCRDIVCVPNGTVLAYSDPAAGEIGTIYQALGWFYIGPSQGGPVGFLVDGKLMTLRSFKRDRKYAVGQSMKEVRQAFPSAKEIVAVGRKHRYVGVFGDRKYKANMRNVLKNHVRPYPKRQSSGENAVPNTEAGCDAPMPLHKPAIDAARTNSIE